MNEGTYKIREPQGQTHELTGNPDLLTLNDVVEEVGKQGGQKWQPNDVRFRINGREYGQRDLSRSLSDIGLTEGTVIEVVPPTS